MKNNKFSSFPEQQKLFENWRKYLNEQTPYADKFLTSTPRTHGLKPKPEPPAKPTTPAKAPSGPGTRASAETMTSAPPATKPAAPPGAPSQPAAPKKPLPGSTSGVQSVARLPSHGRFAKQSKPASKPAAPQSWDAERKGINTKYKTAKAAALQMPKGDKRTQALKAAKSEWSTGRRANWKKRPSKTSPLKITARDKRRGEKAFQRKAQEQFPALPAKDAKKAFQQREKAKLPGTTGTRKSFFPKDVKRPERPAEPAAAAAATPSREPTPEEASDIARASDRRKGAAARAKRVRPTLDPSKITGEMPKSRAQQKVDKIKDPNERKYVQQKLDKRQAGRAAKRKKFEKGQGTVGAARPKATTAKDVDAMKAKLAKYRAKKAEKQDRKREVTDVERGLGGSKRFTTRRPGGGF